MAVPAVDGFGAYQVSWVVMAGSHKAIHCGDTMNHGYWWDFGVANWADRPGAFADRSAGQVTVRIQAENASICSCRG
jgi:hypothetical protein